MTVYIILAVVTVAIGMMIERQEPNRRGVLTKQQALNAVCLLAIFLLLFGVSVCRYRVGNDYTRYEEFFHLIPLHQVVPTEFGFNALVLLLQDIFGLEAKLPIFGFFALFTILLMLAAVYEQSENFAFSFFLFITLSYYFQSLNTVRYYLAWAAALYSMKFVVKRQYLKFVLLILPAATIHKSVLLVLPIYIIANLRWRKWVYPLLVLAGAGSYLLRDQVLQMILRFYSSYEGTSYLDGGTSLINILRILGVMVLCLFYHRQAIAVPEVAGTDAAKLPEEYGIRLQNRFTFQLNLLALLLYTCGSFIPEISRIGYYLTAGHIFLIPSVLARIPVTRTRKLLTVLVILAAVLHFAAFLIKAQDLLVRVVPYHTWIFPGEFME